MSLLYITLAVIHKKTALFGALHGKMYVRQGNLEQIIFMHNIVNHIHCMHVYIWTVFKHEIDFSLLKAT